MVVTLDIGNFDNIPVSNKQEVGFRLARLALKNQYNLENTSSGPIIKEVELIDRKLKIKFDDVGDGLIILDKNSEEFEIADSNMNYLTAKINVLDDYIIVYSEDLTYPKYVRYGWSDTRILFYLTVRVYPYPLFQLVQMTRTLNLILTSNVINVIKY